MTFNFLKEKKPQIGLDIMSNGISAVSLHKKNRNISLKSIGYESFDRELITNGLIKDPEFFTSTLKKLINENGFNERIVNIAVPSTVAFIKNITLPALPINEITKIIPQETSKHIPSSIDELIVDFQVLENTKRQDEYGKKVDVVLVALAKTIVEEYMECIYNAGLSLNAIDINPFAMIRTIANAGMINDPNALYISVLIDYDNTDINIIQGGMPLFSNSIPIGRKNVVDSLMQGFGIDNLTAENMLPETTLIIPGMNIEELDSQKSRAAATVRTVYNSISAEIEKTMEFFNSQNNESREIKKVIIGGCGACLQNIDKYIANRLKMDTVLSNSLNNITHTIDYSDNLISPNNIPALSVSVGLALKGLTE